MSPELGNPMEADGVLNPAAIRGRDGHLYLFPRLVAKGNYSRIGVARVIFDLHGNPTGTERLGIALEPEADYELRGDGLGGCEDPRISYLEPLAHYVMTYTANSTEGPRVAIAVSQDLVQWRRLGLVTFEPQGKLVFDNVDDKDSCFFPLAVPNPDSRLSLAILHRPLFPGTRPEEKVELQPTDLPCQLTESIWISYRDVDMSGAGSGDRCHFSSHRQLAVPVAPWEKLKIGAGTPPVLCRHGWLVVYHGVSEMPGSTPEQREFSYAAGVMILEKDHPSHILYRSPEPVLAPTLAFERIGVVGNVVFPTGIDCRTDLGQPDRFDVYYGMADKRIGVATLTVPEVLPEIIP